MTVTAAIHAFEAGTLNAFTSHELVRLENLLTTKIVFLNQVARQENVAKEVLSDIRKFEVVLKEVSKVLSRKKNHMTLLRFDLRIRRPDFLFMFDPGTII